MGNDNSAQRNISDEEKKRRKAMRNGKPVQLKLFVDNQKKKVMFAEANEDFVEILFSFFTLPLGTIARLSRIYADADDDTKVGSLSSLYESVVNLNAKHFFWKGSKNQLVYPKNSSALFWEKLKVNLYAINPVFTPPEVLIFKKKSKFIITDDLYVIPLALDTSIALLNSLGVECIDLLEERTMYFGFKEFTNLLKWSLSTNNPLTNLVLGGSKPCSPLFKYSTPSNSTSTLVSSNSTRIKLLVQKSKKKVLCAQVENRFVELLFSFLSIPLGTYELLTKDISSPVGISNLYNSISCLGEANYLKSENVKTMLLSPKLANNYYCVTDLLPIYEVSTRPSRFLKEQATFLVSDDLKITASQSIATISKFNPPGIPIGDMELVELSIGEQEAFVLLKASLTSTSALTDCLEAFRKKPKDHVPKIAFAGDAGRNSEVVGSPLQVNNYIDTSFAMVD